MNIKVATTKELTIKEKKDICLLYKEVFGKEKSLSEFIHEFENNEFGYSYYSIMIDNNKIVGSYAVIPLKFNYFNQSLVFGQSVNTMIKEEYRGNPFMLKKLANAVYSKMKTDGIVFVYGFPNDNIYLVRKKILKWKDIYNLDIYLLPLKLDKINNFLKPFNYLTKLLGKFLNIPVSDKVDNLEIFNIYKEYSDIFIKYRFTNDYKKVTLDKNIYGYYRIKDYKNIKTAFIVDIYPLTKLNLELMIKKVYNLEKNIDLIAYFGYLPFKPINMFKVPNKLKPKNTYMSGKILDTNIIDENIFNVENWRTNLSNFDWI